MVHLESRPMGELDTTPSTNWHACMRVSGSVERTFMLNKIFVHASLMHPQGSHTGKGGLTYLTHQARRRKAMQAWVWSDHEASANTSPCVHQIWQPCHRQSLTISCTRCMLRADACQTSEYLAEIGVVRSLVSEASEEEIVVRPLEQDLLVHAS